MPNNYFTVGQRVELVDETRGYAAGTAVQVIEVRTTGVVVRLPNGDTGTFPLDGVTPAT